MTGFSKHVVAVSARIGAAPAKVYGIIADFREGHPRIIPKEFSDLTVESGGWGAGTVIRYKMCAFGRTREVRSSISEPDPGRVLVETTLDSDRVVTTFVVKPGTESGQSEVTILTELPVRGGLLGAMQQFLTTRFLRPVFQRELALLAASAGASVI